MIYDFAITDGAYALTEQLMSGKGSSLAHGQELLRVYGFLLLQLPNCVILAHSDTESLSGRNSHQIDQFFQSQLPGSNKMGIHGLESDLNAHDTESTLFQTSSLLFHAVRCVVGGDHVNGSIENSLDQRIPIFCASQRRIHLKSAFFLQILIGEHQVVGSGFTGHIQTCGLGFADDVHTFLGGNVADVIFHSGFLHQFQVAGDLTPFTFGTDTGVAVGSGVFAVMDVAAPEQVVDFAVGYDHLAQSLCPEHGLAHHVIILDAPAVIGEGDGIGCHISTKESVELIRQAKAKGLDVTCETGPHYLVMDDSFLQEDGRFKMNPPLRSAQDRIALVEGICDGTIDMIATDHAPHSAEEKGRGLAGSAFGVVGIETAFPILYTYLVKKNVITLEKLITLLAINPRTRFGIPMGEEFSVWDLEKEYTIDPANFLSMGKATPFAGWKCQGECKLTICDGNIVYKK